MTMIDHATDAEQREAWCRRLMAERAGLPEWGAGRRARRERLVEIDEALDAWLDG